MRCALDSRSPGHPSTGGVDAVAAHDYLEGLYLG